MKKQLTPICGAVFVFGAVILIGVKFSSSSVKPEPATLAAGIHKKIRQHTLSIPSEAAHPMARERVQPQSIHEEKANLSEWQDRLNRLVADLGSRDAALNVVCGEIDSAYSIWMDQELVDLAGLPSAERYDRLAEIETEMRDGVAAILDQLEMDENLRNLVAPGAADIVMAETHYAEMASSPESRLAMLRLDRERQSRLEQALAISDESSKSQAIAALDGWYDAGIGRIFATPENSLSSRSRQE